MIEQPPQPKPDFPRPVDPIDDPPPDIKPVPPPDIPAPSEPPLLPERGDVLSRQDTVQISGFRFQIARGDL